MKKGDLTNRDINHILSRIDSSKKTAFDKDYADKLYEEYKDHRVDDSVDRSNLIGELQGKEVLLIAPGATIASHKQEIEDYIKKQSPIVISVNFLPYGIMPDYAFFSNNKRYDKIEKFPCKTIVTSNISNDKADFVIDYNSLAGAFDQGINSLIMIIKLLRDEGVTRIAAAGADGYKESGENYFSNNIRSYSKHDNKFNLAVIEAIRSLDVKVRFITPSAYDVIWS